MRITQKILDETLDEVNSYLWANPDHTSEKENKLNQLVITWQRQDHKNKNRKYNLYDGHRQFLKNSTAKELYLFLWAMGFVFSIRGGC